LAGAEGSKRARSAANRVTCPSVEEMDATLGNTHMVVPITEIETPPVEEVDPD
jgi:hypothetical protein